MRNITVEILTYTLPGQCRNLGCIIQIRNVTLYKGEGEITRQISAHAYPFIPFTEFSRVSNFMRNMLK